MDNLSGQPLGASVGYDNDSGDLVLCVCSPLSNGNQRRLFHRGKPQTKGARTHCRTELRFPLCRCDHQYYKSYYAFQVTINAVFFFDVWLTFFRAFKDKDGKLVYSLKASLLGENMPRCSALSNNALCPLSRFAALTFEVVGSSSTFLHVRPRRSSCMPTVKG